MNWAAFVWFLLLVFFVGVEAVTVAMISAWFAAGSLVAMIVSLLNGPMWLQVVLFLVVSAALLLCLRPLARKYFTPRLAKTNLDSIIGSEGLVLEPIDNVTSSGRVKLGAMEWTARSTAGEPIAAGTRIRVDRIEGVKVFVTPLEVPVQ